MYASLLGLGNSGEGLEPRDLPIADAETIVAICAACLGAFPLAKAYRRLRSSVGWESGQRAWFMAEAGFLLALLVWLECVSVMAQHNPFIYFRF